MKEGTTYKLKKESYYEGRHIDTLSYLIIAESKAKAIEWARIDGWIQLKDTDIYTIEEVRS